MKAKIPYKGTIIEVEGYADEIYDLTKRFTEVRREIARPINKSTVTEVQKEVVPTPNMPAKEEIADFISSKGGDFRHTLREIELRFLGRTYDGRIPSEKSPYDKIYIRLVKAREILQKTHGGEWKLKRIPTTHEREYWLERGENKQLTSEDYQ